MHSKIQPITPTTQNVGWQCTINAALSAQQTHKADSGCTAAGNIIYALQPPLKAMIFPILLYA